MTFTPGVPAAAPVRPKWLTLSAVGVFLIAVLGILGGLSALFAVLLGRFHPLAGVPGVPADMLKMIELQKKLMTGPAPTLSVVVGVVGIAVSAWAITTALRVLGAKPNARPGFRRAIVVLGNVELLSLILAVWMQINGYRWFRAFAESFYTGIPGGAHGAEKTMNTFMQGGMLIGIAFAVGVGLLKLGFLVWSYYYAGSRDVVAHLDHEDDR